MVIRADSGGVRSAEMAGREREFQMKWTFPVSLETQLYHIMCFWEAVLREDVLLRQTRERMGDV